MTIQNDNELMELLVQDMKGQDAIWKPSSYWLEYCDRILHHLRKEGLDSFRSDWNLVKGYGYFPIMEPLKTEEKPRAVSRFPWPFTHKGNSSDLDAFQNLQKRYERQYDAAITCHLSLLYHWLSQGEYAGELLRSVVESDVGDPKVYKIDGRNFSPNFLRRINTAAIYLQNFRNKNYSHIIEIGGGYGVAPEIFGNWKPVEDGFFVSIDIPPIIYIQTQYLKSIFPGKIIDYRDVRELDRISEKDVKGKFVLLPPWSLPRLDVDFDCLYNSASFQEMEVDIVTNYLNLVLPRCRSAFITSLIAGHRPGFRGQETQITYDWICEQICDRGFERLARDGKTTEEACFAADMPNYDFAAFSRTANADIEGAS